MFWAGLEIVCCEYRKLIRKDNESELWITVGLREVEGFFISMIVVLLAGDVPTFLHHAAPSCGPPYLTCSAKR